MSHDSLGDRTNDLVSLCDTHRWTVVATLRPQSVAEHSFNVAVIAMELAQRIGITDDLLGVLWWSLVHDAPEIYTGDIDGRMKRDFPAVKQALLEVERTKFPWHNEISRGVNSTTIALVKVADTIEAMTFIRRWGTASRADDVFWELTALLPVHVDALVRAMAMSHVGAADIHRYVEFVKDHSLNDVNSIQMRHRRKENRVQSGVV